MSQSETVLDALNYVHEKLDQPGNLNHVDKVLAKIMVEKIILRLTEGEDVFKPIEKE